MSQLQEELQDHPHWNRIRLVSFSVDPGHDTSKILFDYGTNAGADHDKWHFLTGTRDEIWNLSKNGFKLGVGEAPPNGNSPLFHSAKLILLDGNARMRGLYDGLSQEGLDEVKRDLDRLLAERSESDGAAVTGDRVIPMREMFVPATARTVPWLEKQKEQQLATIGEFTVYTGFTFTDRLPESGIDFLHRITDDTGKTYRPSHYDHGNGVAIADVDAEPSMKYPMRLARRTIGHGG